MSLVGSDRDRQNVVWTFDGLLQQKSCNNTIHSFRICKNHSLQ